jgi:beta-phosphoglucomutase-like phosphatase (HAD superfamily)
VEDSANGVAAAVSAKMKCVVTVSGYTGGEDFSQAEIVLSCLGDPDGEICHILENRSPATPGGYFTVADLEAILRGATAAA